MDGSRFSGQFREASIATMSGQGESAATESARRETDIRLLSFDEACPYLPERQATLRGFVASKAAPALYRQLMDHGFRRSGRLFYQPACAACQGCVPIRVLVDEFAPNRSQRRCRQRNTDITVTVDTPELTDEKLQLYRTYVQHKHGTPAENDMGAVRDFLYNPVVATREFCYRSGDGKLLAVGICDLFADALSSVYCYYDVAEARRGLGTYSALFEIGYARRLRLAYYYLGFVVRQCHSMSYKANFRPHQLLGLDGTWQ